MKVGDVIHGFCGGYFGRDSYACRYIEAIGPDWIVTRNATGGVELVTDLAYLPMFADCRDWCSDDCTGPMGERW